MPPREQHRTVLRSDAVLAWRPAWTQVRRISDLLGTASGILSIAVLAQQAWRNGLSRPLATALKWYVSIVDWLFSPIAPWVQGALAWLQRWRPDDFHPSSQWRHYLVIGVVMLGASIRAGREPKMLMAGLSLFFISVATALKNGASDLKGVVVFLGALLLTATGFAIISVAMSKLPGWTGAESWSKRDAVAYIGSITVVFAGAALFILLSAGFG